MSEDLIRITAVEATRRLRNREVAPIELVDASILGVIPRGWFARVHTASR